MNALQRDRNDLCVEKGRNCDEKGEMDDDSRRVPVLTGGGVRKSASAVFKGLFRSIHAPIATHVSCVPVLIPAFQQLDLCHFVS